MFEKFEILLDNVSQIFHRAKNEWPDELTNWTLPHVKCTVKGNVAGWAYFHKNQLDFNWKLYRKNFQQFLESTVPHEVSHLIAFHIYGNIAIEDPHGCIWFQIMRKLGIQDPQVVHNFQTFPISYYVYKCDCGENCYSLPEHRRLRSNFFSCPLCKMPLAFLERIAMHE